MADQEFLASFAVEIDEAGVNRLKTTNGTIRIGGAAEQYGG